MIDPKNKIYSTSKRMIADKMNTIIGRFCMDESLDNIVFRANILDLTMCLGDLLEEYEIQKLSKKVVANE